MNTVKSLRQSNYKIRISHCRNVNLKAKKNDDMSLTRLYKELNEPITAKGGKTIVELTFNGKNARGEALCSIGDGYNRKLGVQVALGRALNQLTLITENKIVELTPAV